MTIEPTDKSSTTINVWDATGNAKVTVKVYPGDELEYKRNGGRGWMRCHVSSIRNGRLGLLPMAGGRRFSVPATSWGFAQLFRNGNRVTI